MTTAIGVLKLGNTVGEVHLDMPIVTVRGEKYHVARCHRSEIPAELDGKRVQCDVYLDSEIAVARNVRAV